MSLLFEDKPLVINPGLAELIGLNEAIVIQQMNYWIKRSDKFIDGKTWIYNSISKWAKQFPFFSEATIKRTIKSLESKGLLFVGNYNRDGRDRTKWYSINYDAINQLVGETDQSEQCTRSNCTNALGQNDQMHEVKLHQPLPETTTENTTNKKINKKTSSVTVDEMVDSLTGLSRDVASDYLLHRKAKKTALTPRAWAGVCREVKLFTKQTGRPPDDALIEAIERDWKSVKCDWLLNSLRPQRIKENQIDNDSREWAEIVVL